MITDRIIQYVLTGLLIAAGAWGLWQWSAKLKLQHTLDEYRIAQANLVTKAQEDYINGQNREMAAADAARRNVKSATAAVEAKYHPIVAAYDTLYAGVLKSQLEVGALPPGAADASGTEGSTCDGRLAGISRQYASVVEAASRVAANFAACAAGIARYRAAVGWADTP